MNKINSNFYNAVIDYRFLMEKCYPHKAALKLVGDRYRLTKYKRNCLFRGVMDTKTACLRRKKLIDVKRVKKKRLGIDWYNILITLESYRKGLPVFISDDRIIRDASGVHGSYKTSQVTEELVPVIIDAVKGLHLQYCGIYLDEPLSFSREMAVRIKGYLKGLDHFQVDVVQSADFILKSQYSIAASSDSIIIDNVDYIFDLVCFILRQYYRFKPPLLKDIKEFYNLN
jgi:hypothetical protein